MKVSLELFSPPFSICFSKIHTLGYLPLHVFDLQEDEVLISIVQTC